MKREAARPWLVLGLISSALFLVSLDMTVLYTALPTLSRELGATEEQKLWIVNIYPLVMAALLPATGPLGDRAGHRRTFLGGLALFGAASLGSAWAPSAPWLMVGRAALAGGAALMMPATLSLLRRTFTRDRDRAVAIGVWGSVASGAAALGPIIGGYLLGHAGWGSVFLINVPVALATLALGPLCIPDHPGHPDRPWDPWGSIQIGVALASLVYALKAFVNPHPAPLALFMSAGLGLGCLACFLYRQKGSPSPLVDASLFRAPDFSAGVLAILASMLALTGVELALTQRLQLVQGLSPLRAGAFTLPISLASFAAGPLAGRAFHRFGARRTLLLFLSAAAVGLTGLLLLRDIPGICRILSMLLLGLGAGGGMAAASTALLTAAPESKAGMAASVDTVTYELGSTLGIAIIGSIMTSAYRRGIALSGEWAGVEGAGEGLQQALSLARNLDAGRGRELAALAIQAFDRAFVMGILAAMAVLYALCAGLLTFRKGTR